MEKDKKELLKKQVAKLDDVLKTLEANFDIESDLADEYSFLSTVTENLKKYMD